jgi:hypothetical protein
MVTGTAADTALGQRHERIPRSQSGLCEHLTKPGPAAGSTRWRVLPFGGRLLCSLG